MENENHISTVEFQEVAEQKILIKLVNEKLKQTRQNYETFFNTIEDFLFVLDEKGQILHVNKTVIDRLGYDERELIGETILMVHPVERREEAGRITGEMIAGIAHFCPVPIITKWGNLIPVETRVTPGIWNGSPAFFGVTKDISQIKLSEEKFSKVFYLNPSACGLSEIDTGKYVEVNEAFYQILGFDKDEVIGNTASNLGIMSDEVNEDILKRRTDDTKIKNFKVDLRAKNGEIKHVLLSAEDIFIQDRKLRYTVINDITELIEAVEALKESEDILRQLIVTKDKFFSIIAHDLKSPFTAIMGFSNLLAEKIRDKDYNGIEEYSQIIQTSSRRAISLLLNLLEWARSQTGRMDYHPQETDLSLLFDEVTELATDSAKQKAISIAIEAPEMAPIIVDKSMISAVLRNLISNAVKFTNPGGRITISVEQVPKEIRINVRDNGIGMDKTTIEKLFRIDQNVSVKGTQNETGTGLGLILCHEFVQKHGGTIGVESEPGKGSNFHFTIPVST